jgi:hypothetical protein
VLQQNQTQSYLKNKKKRAKTKGNIVKGIKKKGKHIENKANSGQLRYV